MIKAGTEVGPQSSFYSRYTKVQRGKLVQVGMNTVYFKTHIALCLKVI